MKRKIYLAAGCFWGTQAYFRRFYGIIETSVGYANGNTLKTSYKELKNTLHVETLELIYDDNIIRLEEILLHYFKIIDPLSLNKQGEDEGTQYRTGIYYEDDNDLKIINKILNYEQKKYDEKILVEVDKINGYILAEDYHQDYLEKNPTGYCHIHIGKLTNPIDFELKNNKLNEEEYNITQLGYTEAPYSSKLNDEFNKGIYVNVVTGEPIFISDDKFNSNCGWPSFSRPIFTTSMNYYLDTSLGMERTEVKTSRDEAHLGHVFKDGPLNKGGLRYCINGSALKFISYDDLEKYGYEDFKVLF